MNFKKRIILFLSIILFFGCNDLKNRYDPVEASRNIFQMKEFVFYSMENPLTIDAWGKVNNGDYTVTVPYPPSESLTAAPLTARFWIENIGLDGGEVFELSRNQYWNDSPTIALSSDEFGYDYNEEPLFEPEYDIIMEPRFTVELEYLSSIHFNAGSLSFNMNFNDDAAPAYLGQASFIMGFGVGAANNFMSLGAGNFSPTMPSGGLNYSVSMTPATEGQITVQFAAGSVQETVSFQENEESNQLTYYYDITAPTTGSITVSGLDVSSTTTPAETILTLSFPPASDNYTTSDDLYYEIYTSNTSGANTNLLASSSGYPSDLVFTNDELDTGTLGLLIGNTTIFVNVTVKDLANNQVQYAEGSQIYTGLP